MTLRRLTAALATVALLAACNGRDAAYVDEVRAGPHPSGLTDEQIIELGDAHCGQLREYASTGAGDNRDPASLILMDMERSMVDYGASQAEARHMIASAVRNLCPTYEYGL